MKSHRLLLLLVVLLFVSLALAMILTLPAIGFYYGFVSCEEAITKTFGHGPGAFSWRIISGLFCALIVTFENGRMPDNEGGTSYTDLRHHIVPTFFYLSALIYSAILIFFGVMHLIHRKVAKYNRVLTGKHRE